jgi:hypothetical protein
MSNLKLLYLMTPPDGGVDVKIGITALEKADSRLGNYQNSLGPRFTCKWVRCWVGDGSEIVRLEKVLKRHYKNNIINSGRGHTEWIADIFWTEIEPVVNETIEGHRFKVKPVEKQFLPLSMKNLNSLRENVLNSLGKET